MTVHYSGFKLTQDQAQRLLTHALDQLLGGTALVTRRRAPRATRQHGDRQWSAAQRKAVSKRMKAMWKKRRAAESKRPVA